MNKRRWMQHKSYHNSRAGKDAPNQSRSLQAQPPSSPLAPGMRATPKRAGRRRTQRSPADVPVPISTPPCSDGTAPAHCTGRQRPRAIPPRRSRSCPCHHPSRRGGPGVGPGWTVVPASGSFSGRLCMWRFAGGKAIGKLPAPHYVTWKVRCMHERSHRSHAHRIDEHTTTPCLPTANDVLPVSLDAAVCCSGTSAIEASPRTGSPLWRWQL